MTETREYLVEPYYEHGVNDNVVRGSSGVKITHLPTGLTEVCSEERSQLQNREIALKRLHERVIAGE